MSKKARQLGSIGFGGLTPLLDTLFILLFAMLVTSEAKTDDRPQETEQEVRVTLPAVESGASDESSSSVTVAFEIDASSTIRLTDLDRAVDSRSELDRWMSELIGDSLPEDVTVELRADRDAKHGVAAELLQYLRLRGFANVQLLATGFDSTGDRFGGQQ